MVDASCQDPEENVTACAKIVQSANAKGIAIEAEMGRIMGSGDALPRMERSLESLMTDPDIAKVFIKRTGVQFLASSFGNIHGHYGAMRAEDVWKVTLPSGVNSAVPDIALVLHRTHGVSDELFLEAAKRGVTMINLNQTVKKDYTDFTSRYAGTLELTELKAQGVAVYAFLSPSSP
ncbi:uncharacterized protein HMPREF1541_03535 [Cyphellophora europaea CBS 101466]|uniref:Fructose-bisphosphate aldolase n=1 Tax=Cyphellophora europaea (strain CBS 101466) TaxID=1220924 RepID=W2S0W5_CYPE1|nr:uncharacterized protein HMPREF1541_03535 [Cyphellophora europaea CBS 101466]ETN41599.1 hypothetical protein HMPREF1541_03535 [Cyphellophora europaea CBS 101466]